MAKRTWADLRPAEKRSIYAAGAVEAVLTAVALVDLARRPADGVRGPKWAWVLAFAVQPFGPMSYFALGRRARD